MSDKQKYCKETKNIPPLSFDKGIFLMLFKEYAEDFELTTLALVQKH
jgi:hypothetical protein